MAPVIDAKVEEEIPAPQRTDPQVNIKESVRQKTEVIVEMEINAPSVALPPHVLPIANTDIQGVSALDGKREEVASEGTNAASAIQLT